MSKNRRYQFLKIIASGGFGDVYLAKEINNNGIDRLIAIKLLKSDWADNLEIVNRLQDEAKLLALLRHKNIINVFDMTSIKGRASIIMEFVDGVDLSMIIAIMRQKRRRAPVSIALLICSTVAQALDVAYNQSPFPGEAPLKVVHRDIKPGNIMIDVSGMVKVLDFGIAQSMFDNRVSQTSELRLGSIEYMAPERLLFEPDTPASDIYALALVLYECLTGEPFGEAKRIEEEHNNLVKTKLKRLRSLLSFPTVQTNELIDILDSALCYDPDLRCSTQMFMQRTRALARTMKGVDIVVWAEKAIPLLQKTSKAYVSTASLQGRIIEEDDILVSEPEDEDDATLVRTNPPPKETRELVAFVEVQRLEEDPDSRTEILMSDSNLDTTTIPESSYFQDSTLSSLSNGTLKKHKAASTKIFNVVPPIKADEAFPEEDSVVSVVVQPVPFSTPKTTPGRKWVWLLVVIVVFAAVCTGLYINKDQLREFLSENTLQKDFSDTSAVALDTGTLPSKEEPLDPEPQIPQGAIVFISDTVGYSIRATCADEVNKKEKKRFKEQTLVYLQHQEVENCTLQLITKKKERLYATIKKAASGNYTCYFETQSEKKGLCERIEE